MKLTDDYIDLVTDTANDVVKAHGWFTHVSRDDVQIVLQALELIYEARKAIHKKKR
jgi:hypothetical protein